MVGGRGTEGEGIARAREWEVRQRPIASTLQSPAGDSSPYEGEPEGSKVAAGAADFVFACGRDGGCGRVWEPAPTGDWEIFL